MASFSRGFSCVGRQNYFTLPASLRLATAPRPTPCLHSLRITRNFAFSPIRRIPKPKNLAKPIKVPQTPTKPPSQSSQNPNPRLKASAASDTRIALGGQPTLLYKAPSQTYYAVVAYVAAAAAATSGMWIFKNFYLELPPGLAWWVPPVYGSIALILAGLSLWCVAAPVWLIRSIHAVPVMHGVRGLRIEGMRLPLPGFKPFVMMVPKGDVTFTGYVAPQARMFEGMRALMHLDLWAGLKKESIVLRPFFFVGHWFVRLASRIWTNTKIILGRYGMVYVDIPGEGRWKLDTSGWVAEGGRPLDKMVRVIPPEGWISRD